MPVFKDLLRLVALALLVRAVMNDSVACAIASGTLYMGGFDSSLHISRYLPKKLVAKKALAEGPVAEVITLRNHRGPNRRA